MITGDKLLETAVTPSSDTAGNRIKAAGVLLICAGLVWGALTRLG
jgi:hypothetical protein